MLLSSILIYFLVLCKFNAWLFVFSISHYNWNNQIQFLEFHSICSLVFEKPYPFLLYTFVSIPFSLHLSIYFSFFLSFPPPPLPPCLLPRFLVSFLPPPPSLPFRFSFLFSLSFRPSLRFSCLLLW